MPDPLPAARPAAPAGSSGDGESIRVIVIDGEEGTREGVRRALEERGFAVRTASDVALGLRLMRESCAEVALVDVSLPPVDGLSPTECITQRCDGRTVVVITSALPSVETAVQVTRHGAFDFLIKPFSTAELVRVVERAGHQSRLVRERERYLSELAGERNLSHQLITSMHEGVVVFNIRRALVLMNPRAEHFLGTHFREGMSLPELFPDLDTAAAIEAVIDSAPARPECRLVQRSLGDGRMQVSISPLLLDGEAGGAIVILSDVTESWKAEQDKNRFVSMVAHELKSPLSAIINYINVIQSGMFDDTMPKIHEMLDRCRVRGEALLDLVRDLLYINSREVGKVERSIESVDLKTVIAGQLDFFRVQADKRRISLSLEAPLAAYPLKADRGDLDRIFMNLISNGIKYNRDKGVLAVRMADKGAAWEIAVSDTGIGLSDAERASIFQEFYRVKNQKTAGIAGTGLGLATVRRVLTAYNGRISVSSQPDAGSTFTVTLPKE